MKVLLEVLFGLLILFIYMIAVLDCSHVAQELNAVYIRTETEVERGRVPPNRKSIVLAC